MSDQYHGSRDEHDTCTLFNKDQSKWVIITRYIVREEERESKSKNKRQRAFIK
jgi:hypothetical protein